GPWEVSFDPQWGGPAQVTFDQLDDWSKRPEHGIRYYSGKATYRKTFDFPPPATRESSVFVDLGTVKNVAAVRLNGRDLGIVWCAPWRVDVTDAIKPKDNALEIGVINLWPNRLIGDADQPPEKRFTKSNVPSFKSDTSLLPSGLLGPVTIYTSKESR
ncbi:MAG: glycosyl transferase family 2, partial [Planctomycetes bacterium]|nr:glycosyl transferase family 2 [Planctomycetota bacterium]